MTPRSHARPFGRPVVGPPTQGAGVTLAELLVVVTIMGVLLGVAVLRIGGAADQTAARSAVAEAAAAFNGARETAVTHRASVAVYIDTARARLEVRWDSVVILSRDLRAVYGVLISATRDSMAYDPQGRGIGAANLSLTARRGRAADTLFVSRLGRVRH
jgi:Tfp pilus assembly protein FimT